MGTSEIPPGGRTMLVEILSDMGLALMRREDCVMTAEATTNSWDLRNLMILLSREG